MSSLHLEDDDLKFWKSTNTLNLGDLLNGFLNFYANFKYGFTILKRPIYLWQAPHGKIINLKL